MKHTVLSALFLGLVWNSAMAGPFRFTLLHTNDLHSHFEGSGPDGYYDAHAAKDPVRGHYARLATAIRAEKARYAKDGVPTLLLDAGDFFSGTLLHALAPRGEIEAIPEIEFFQYCGYDAVTLGNHEFDPGEAGLLTVLKKTKRLGFLEKLVTTNAKVRPENRELAALFGEMPKSRLIDLKSGGETLRVGILGFLGLDAARVSAGYRKTVSFTGYDDAKGKERFKDLAALAKKESAALRKAGASVVIALIHGGAPEDEKLAAVPGIDLVVAGHTHVLYPTPKAVGKAWVVQAGSYGKYLGRAEWLFEAGKGLKLLNRGATSVGIDGATVSDPEYLAKLSAYKDRVAEILRPTGYSFDTPVATFAEPIARGEVPESPLGRFITTGLCTELGRRLNVPFDAYFTSIALIRDDITTVSGKPTRYQFSDIFRVLSIGFGPGMSPGSPIRSVYVSKRDFLKLLNTVEAYRLISSNFGCVFSDSVSYRVRSWGIPFVNRLADVTLHGKPYREWPELIHLATNDYVSGFFGKIPAMTYGLVKLTPRDSRGKPIAEPEALDVPAEPFLFADYLKHHPR